MALSIQRIFGSVDRTLPLQALLQAILAPDPRMVQVEIGTPLSSIRRVVSHRETEMRENDSGTDGSSVFP